MKNINKFKSTILPAVIGNTLEWYDFTLYAYFAAIFAKQYFPQESSFISLLEVYGLFAAGYIMRPVGAIVFGYIGDRIGRKYSLAYSILIMGGCSFLLSILPTYAEWGVFASISLALIRLMQGFAVGGEYSGASIFLIENAPVQQRTFFGSLALASAYSGFVLSAVVGVILSSLFSEATLSSWGWRLGFAVGGIIAIIGFYIRNQLKDTKTFQKEILADPQKINPLKNLFYYHPKTFIYALGIAILPAGFSYMIFVYFSTFLNLYTHHSQQTILSMNVIVMLAAIIFIPVVGFIADKIGRRTIMLISALIIMIACIPLSKLLMTHTLIALLLFTLLNALYEASIPSEIAEMFAANYRYSGLALTLNLTNGIAGGFAPIIASILIQNTHQLISPMYYILALAFISIISLIVSRV